METEAIQTRYKVDGIDCASCAAKIEGAVRRVRGVGNVAVSVTTRSMTVDHDESADLGKLEKRVRALGYGAERLATEDALLEPVGEACCDHAHDHDHHHHHCDDVDHHHGHGHDHPHEHAHSQHDGHDHGLGDAHAAEDAALPAAGDGSLVTRFKVDGMDCASCAAKIDGAARRVKGVEDVRVSVTTRSMSVSHDPSTDLDKLEKRVGALGYGTSRLADDEAVPEASGAACCGHDHEHEHGHVHQHDHDHGHAEGVTAPGEEPAAEPWYRDGKIRITVATGVALAIAAAVAQMLPAVGPWLFGLAMLIGLVPVARRAIMGAWLAGAPFSIEMLMTIAAVGAVALGATQEAAVVVFLFLLGELLEGVAAGRARSSISALSDLVPKTALRVNDDGSTLEVPADSLAKGATVLVRPGDRIPADGVVLDGESAVDQAPVTGESTPVFKKADDTVFAGTINGDKALRVSVTAAAKDNTIARVVRLVEEAQELKAPTERFIDRFSRYYTPGVVVVAALVAAVPPLAFAAPWSEWIYKGLAILLIGCPCALVISTPAAIAASLSAGARRGLLIKGGAVLETLGKINAVAFDKTGTLTEGKPTVTDVIAFGSDDGEALRLAAALESGSSHPLARAILARAKDCSGTLPTVENASAVGGKGVTGRVDGQDLFLGSLAAAAERTTINAKMDEQARALHDEGKSVAVLVAGDAVLGLIAMRDEPRPDALQAMKAFGAEGIRTVMLTGDNARTAEAIGRKLGVEVRADLMPEDKQRIVGELRREGLIVAKVGDGINDAPALAAADVGIAMGGGTDVALETGDAASLHGRVGDVGEMIALSKRTMANIKQNISIALGLKAVFLVTTIVGLTGLWPAILADTGATVLVTANALRLLRVPAVNAPPDHGTSADDAPVRALSHGH